MISFSEIRIIGVSGIGEVVEGDDLGAQIASALRGMRLALEKGDVLVVAQKVVSKSEGRVVRLDSIEPSALASGWARRNNKDARIVELVLRESKRVLRMERGILICETKGGFICANAGVDVSNAVEGAAVLLPADPDASARRIRDGMRKEFGVRVGVIVSDTFGRPFREGLVNVALGVSGMAPLIDYRGRPDSSGRPLRSTTIAVADELASAAELVMKKADGVPVAVIRGLLYEGRDGSGRELIRERRKDLFR